MPDQAEMKKYEELSPFEVKNKLIEMAGGTQLPMLNAGRGNPNWVATEPRHAFFQLGHFAVAEAEREMFRPGIAAVPNGDGMLDRFNDFLANNAREPGVDLLKTSLGFIERDLGIDPAAFVLEMVDGILGDHYPVPDRMLRCSEQIVSAYLDEEMSGTKGVKDAFDLFATEGGTAAMTYIFNSLMENKILHKGDKIALGAPIFTPYLEIPLLNDFEFVELEVMQDEESGWKYAPEQIEKLSDPDIKAFFLVNPSNPTSVAMHPETLRAIHTLIETRRKDLIVLTDDVYGTFVNGFQSLASIVPANTILVYSYSKYFGATGWRLGVIGLAKDNILDQAIANLAPQDKAALHKRYETVYLNPEEAKMIDRMVADSRTVALNHTAGLSTPQQVFMVMLSLSSLVDQESVYKEHCQDIVIKRFQSLYRAVGVPHPETPFDAHYYTTIDIPEMAQERYSPEFRAWLTSNHKPLDFVWRLAEEKAIVLMDGGGFDAPEMSVRVSLANLPDKAYAEIGKGISDLLAEYHDRFQAAS
ncbi:MAG: bifunctional aspartate transaminase/aspartate 4-decarboxylase [Phycisphaerales bacterium]|jgi:aspartate 4-decarboxylase|nr:bifunctional aspartate transaminase/aspartate 4-decarboxylase [Phycisphaerales bacterium]